LHARLQYSCCLVSLVASTHFTTAMAGSLSLSWSVARSLLIAARRLKRPRQLPHARETSRVMRRTGRTSGCRWPCGASPPRAPRSSPDSPPPPASAIDSSIALRSCVSSSSSSSPPYSPPPPLPPRLLHFELRVPRHHHHLEAVEIHHGQDRADGGALDIRCADVLAARALRCRRAQRIRAGLQAGGAGMGRAD
jgi:hypothetical protein